MVGAVTSILPVSMTKAATTRARAGGLAGARFALSELTEVTSLASLSTASLRPPEQLGLQHGLMALQDEAEDPDALAGRQARGLLDRLAAMQMRLLGDDPVTPDVLAALREALRELPCARDPRLVDALAAVTLRVEVELARHEAG